MPAPLRTGLCVIGILVAAATVAEGAFSLQNNVIQFGDSIRFNVVCADHTAFRWTRQVATIICGSICASNPDSCGVLFTKPASSLTANIKAHLNYVSWNDDAFVSEIPSEASLIAQAQFYPDDHSCARVLAVKCHAESTTLSSSASNHAVTVGPSTVSDSLPICFDDEATLWSQMPVFLEALDSFFPTSVFVPGNKTVTGPFLRLLPPVLSFTIVNPIPNTLNALYQQRMGLSSQTCSGGAILNAAPTSENFENLARLVSHVEDWPNPVLDPSGVVAVSDHHTMLCADHSVVQLNWASKICTDQNLQVGTATPSFFFPDAKSYITKLDRNISYVGVAGCPGECSPRLLAHKTFPVPTCTTLVGVNCSYKCEVDIGDPRSNDEAVLYGGIPLCSSAPGVYRLGHAYCASLNVSDPTPQVARTRFVFSTESTPGTNGTDLEMLVGTWPKDDFYPDDIADPQRWKNSTENAQCTTIRSDRSATVRGKDPTTNCIPFALTCDEWDPNCDFFIDASRYGVVFMRNQTALDRTTALSGISYFDDQMQREMCRFVDHAYNAATARYVIKRSYVPLVNTTYSLSTASCRYTECLKAEMCNSAMQDPPGEELLMAVDCNITRWWTRLQPNSQSRYKTLTPPLKLLEENDIVGTLEAKPILTGPSEHKDDTISWYAFSAESAILSVTKHRFQDETALVFCNEAGDPTTPVYTAADALMGYGGDESTKVQISDWHCLTLGEMEQPMNDCHYVFHQYDIFALAPSKAVGVRCGYQYQDCPRFSKFESIGAFCGAGIWAGKTLWISANEEGTFVSNINPTTQPWDQPPGAVKAHRLNLEGYNCRLGHGAEALASWRALLNDTVGVLSGSLTFLKNPLTGVDDTIIEIVDSSERSPSYFYTCNSCPSTAPVGAYCREGRPDLDYFEFKSSEGGSDFYEYFEAQPAGATKVRKPICTADFTVFSDLPGKPCWLKKSSNAPKCEQLEGSRLQFDVESATFLRTTPGSAVQQPYRLCEPIVAIQCEATLNQDFCGNSVYHPGRSVRIGFGSDGAEIVYNPEGDAATITCDRSPYKIRSSPVGCVLDIGALFNYSGCLRDTGLFGRAQGKQPVIYEPTNNQVLLNLLDDTYYLNPCRKCKFHPNEYFCSVYGHKILHINSVADYGLNRVGPNNGNMATWPSAKLVEAQEPCLYYLQMPHDHQEDYRAIQFGSDDKGVNISFHEVTQQGDKRVLNPHSDDQLLQCASNLVATEQYCSSSPNFDIKITVQDALHVMFENVQHSGPGSEFYGVEYPTNYLLLPEQEIFMRQDVVNFLVHQVHPLFKRVKYIVYRNQEEGLLALVDEFGYVLFTPCQRRSLLLLVGFPTVLCISFLIICYLIFARVRFFRGLDQSVTEFRKKLESTGGQLNESTGMTREEELCQHVHHAIERHGKTSVEACVAVFHLANLCLMGSGNDKAEKIVSGVLEFAASKLPALAGSRDPGDMSPTKNVAGLGFGENGEVHMLTADEQMIRRVEILTLACKKGPLSALRRAASLVEGTPSRLLSDHVQNIKQEQEERGMADDGTGSSLSSGSI